MHPELNYMIAQQRIAELARIGKQRRIRNEVPVEHADPSRSDWIAVAAVLVGAGWGSDQFPPTLLVRFTRRPCARPTPPARAITSPPKRSRESVTV